jgi:hypothetical protein
MLILGGSLVYSRTITKRPGLNRTGRSATLQCGRDTRLKILIQEYKAKRPCWVSTRAPYWGPACSSLQPLDRFRGKLESVGRAGTTRGTIFRWVGGDEAEAAAGSDLVKEEFDYQIEDGDEGEPAAKLLPPRGTRRPRPT